MVALSEYAEKLPFAELRDGKFRQHPQWPVMAETGRWENKQITHCEWLL
jgi:hypothetical protein